MDSLVVSGRLGAAPTETEPIMTSPVTRIDRHTFGPWAIVTGASSGIGKEFARQLAASGFHVVLVARRLSTLEELGGRLATEFGVQYRAVGVDLTEEHFLSKLAEATHDLDIGLVVSNAGTSMLGDFVTMDERALQRSLRLNVQAHLDMAHHFGQHLARRRRGGLLLTASTAGLQGIPFSAEYAAAKAYVLALGEGLHGEWQQVGVHVTVLLPGATDTPLLAASGFEHGGIGRSWQEDGNMHTHLLQLAMESLSERQHIGFGGGILRTERNPLQARRRCGQQQPTTSTPGQVLPEMVRHVQMRFDVETQTPLQGPGVHGQKIAKHPRSRVGNHEANVQVMGGVLQLLDEIADGEVQTNGSILDA